MSAVRAGGEEEERPLPRVVDALGWCGSAAIVAAYLASSRGWIAQGALYHGLNLGGAAAVGWVCWWKRAWQPLSLEVVWGGIALLGLLRP